MDTQAIVDAIKEAAAGLVIIIGACTVFVLVALDRITTALEQRNEEKK
jgi:ABC-type proline/glycine betaine transport system permease subunit